MLHCDPPAVSSICFWTPPLNLNSSVWWCGLYSACKMLGPCGRCVRSAGMQEPIRKAMITAKVGAVG